MVSRQLTAARKHLSDAQLIAFLREAGKEERPRTARMYCDLLDEGRSLERIFLDPKKDALLASVLEVWPRGTGTYEIRCGFDSAQIGEGATWLVRYGTQGELLSTEVLEFWVS